MRRVIRNERRERKEMKKLFEERWIGFIGDYLVSKRVKENLEILYYDHLDKTPQNMRDKEVASVLKQIPEIKETYI